MALKFDKLPQALKIAVNDSIDRNLMQLIGEQAAFLIKTRTRLGYGTSEDRVSNKEKLKKLSDKYIERRRSSRKDVKRRAKKGISETGFESINTGLTTPAKSNLTFTGRMLDAIRGKASSSTKATVQIQGDHGDGLSNKDLAKYVAKAGRPFFNLTTLEVKQLSNTLREVVLKRVNEKLTK